MHPQRQRQRRGQAWAAAACNTAAATVAAAGGRAAGGGPSALSAVPNRSVGDTGGGSRHAPPWLRGLNRVADLPCAQKKRSSIRGGPPSAAQQSLESPGRGARAWTGRRRSPALQMAWLTQRRPEGSLRNQTRQARASATADGRACLYSAGAV